SRPDVDQLVSYVEGELGDIVELVVPLSARQALGRPAPGAARTGSGSGGGDPGERERDGADDGVGDRPHGNWAALQDALEQRFFARARELKRAALSQRLRAAVARAREIIGGERDRCVATAAALRQAADSLLDVRAEFIDEVVVTQRRALADAAEELQRRAAREVLDLVRPRQLPFGSHSATPADRDYLLSLLDSGYEAALARSQRQVVAILREHGQTAVRAASGAAGAVGDQAVDDVLRTAEDALRLIDAQVFDRTLAYVRGYLRGGYIADFFQRDLPKLDLAEEAAYLALSRQAPDVDAEIALRLATAGADVLHALATRLGHWADVADIAAYDIEIGIVRALDNADPGP
ncbi:MAG: hypothetical protein AAGC55_31785, partial [Myxococcota bacterium]